MIVVADLHEAVQRDPALGHAAVVDEAHAVLDAGAALEGREKLW
jgi:hypothetical protein